jgi:manganese transport protein
VFLASLIASGISSATVGTMAGQLIMQGFVGFRIPVWLRRAVTMIPAFVVVGLGVNATDALVVSQVLLSLTLPFPMVALLIFTHQREVMGDFVNSRATTILAFLAAAVVLALNTVLLLQSVGLAS